MDYVNLGQTGLKVSRLCLGCMTYGTKAWREWVLEEDEAKPFIRQALEAGINFFDTADMYSVGASEEILGRALKEFGVPRDRSVIATKVFSPMSDDPNDKGLSRKHIMHSIDNSLRRLGTDYVDLYQIHRFDYETPIEETLEALTDIVKSGKALYIGASSMHAWQFTKMLLVAEQMGFSKFVSMQNHYNLMYREEEREMIPLCQDQNIALIPWSPLARGQLAGNKTANTTRAQTDDFSKHLYTHAADGRVIDRVTEVAAGRGVPPAQVALAWVLSKPHITSPIVGASKPHHLDDAVAALSLSLDEQEIKRLEEVYEPHAVLGHS
jgi:aryl-alcohol dehydrogenase-like predicted oxidoreductase